LQRTAKNPPPLNFVLGRRLDQLGTENFMEERIFKGYNGDLTISDAGISIYRGAKGFLLQGMTIRGEKQIPWESIVAVQYKKASILGGVGYIQLSLRGGSEAKGGLIQATQDENTVTWSNINSAKKNEEFAEARDIILAKLVPVKDTKVCPACAEDIKAAAKICRFCGHKFEELD
jgi:hypothetical protein